MVHRISRKQKPCSAETGAYCQARKRLPEKFFSDALVKQEVRWIQRQRGLALERASRSCLRRIDRFDARYAGEPGRLPTAGCSRNLESDFQWPASQPSSRSPVERCSIWESAATQARGKVNWGCYANYVEHLSSGDIMLADRYDVFLDGNGDAQATWR
jgi:hypothetical protein